MAGVTPALDQMRECRECKAQKPLANFPRTRGKYFWQCKTCSCARSQRWAERNRDRSNEIKKRYSELHPDMDLAAKQKCYEANRKRYIAAAAARKVSQRDRVNANYRKQYADNPEPFLRRARRRDVREAFAEGEVTRLDEQILMAKQAGRCVGCRIEIGEGVAYHADHIIPLVSGGSHWPENRQLLCVRCNHKKGVKSDTEWRRAA